MTLRPILTALLSLCLLTSVAVAAKFTWAPVEPGDFEPLPAAPAHDAECLFAKRSYTGSKQGSEISGYFRFRVNTEKGVEKHQKVEVKLSSGEKLRSIRARVLRSDGTIVELKEADFVHSRENKRSKDKDGKVTFTIPNLKPGDIYEYVCVTGRDQDVASMIVPVQRGVPIRLHEYRFKSGLFDHLIFWTNLGDTTAEKKSREIIVTSRNVPAFVPEPLMPAEPDHSAWLGMVPIPTATDSQDMWEEFSNKLSKELKDAIRPNKVVQETASGIVGSETDPTQKLRKLYEYCQREIANLSDNSSERVAALRRARDENPPMDVLSPKDVIKRKAGTAGEIRLLFAALATAAGLEPQAVAYARATELRSTRTNYGWRFLRERTLLFDLGGTPFICSPQDAALPFGLIAWTDETANAMIASGKKPAFFTLPINDPEATRIDEIVRARVNPDGTLEGTVSITSTGMEAWDLRTDNWRLGREELDLRYRKEFNERVPQAEITELTWSDLAETTAPLVITFKLRIPNYAEVIGNRLSLPLNPLRLGAKSPFTATTREFPVMFKNTEHRVTRVELEYPEGYQPEQPGKPAGFGTERSVISLTYDVQHSPSRRLFTMRRDLVLGRGPGKEFLPKVYPAFKQAFDLMDQSDSHRILLTPAGDAETKAEVTAAMP
ncbi:MAG: DUF3857 domain-containing protein [Opitutaceae bacterium]|nr:DUF3857 domain-containing protein [Opitutaceae bacterium]